MDLRLGNLCTGGLAAAVGREVVGIEGSILALIGRLRGVLLPSFGHRTGR